MPNQYTPWPPDLKARLAELWRDETVRRHELPGLLERTMNAIAYQAKVVDLGPRWDTALGRSEGGSKRWGATPKTTPAPKPKREPATRADTADSEAERAAAERQAEAIRRYYATQWRIVAVEVVQHPMATGAAGWSARIVTPMQAAASPAPPRRTGLNPGWLAR